MTRPTFFAAFALLVLASAVMDDATRFGRHVVLLSGAINTAETPSLKAEHLSTRAINSGRTEQFLLHMPGPITEAAKARVNALLAPAKLGQYFPHNTFLVEATSAEMVRIAAANHPEILWVGDYPAANRLHPQLERKLKQLRSDMKDITPEVAPEEVEMRLLASFAPSESRTQAEAESIVESWTAALKDFPNTRVVAVTPRRVSVVTTDNAVAVANVLASQPECHWVEPKTIFRTHNWWANSLIQGGTQPPTPTTPFHDMGLDGTGMIVGIGDSGLDISHCAFNDPNVALPVTTVTNGNLNNINVVTNPNHRKVVQYIAYVDSTDSSSASGGGHGSHVCGTVAGNSNQAAGSISKTGDGLAPGAKIAFFDMSPTPVGSNTASGAIKTPDDMVNQYFVYSYAAGARIHSNSWGSSPIDPNTGAKDPNYYTGNDQDFDTYMNNNKDFLVMVAAGNDGDSGINTIGSPAVAKNVVSVGAASNTAASWVNYFCCNTDQVEPCLVDPTKGGTCTASDRQGLLSEGDMWSEEGLAQFSSQGPISVDGRTKPDITAPGFQTMSVNSNGASTTAQCNSNDPTQYLTYKSGTSMATPTTSGTVAIIRQYYTEGWYPGGAKNATATINPSSALMKATLISGAVPMTGAINDGQGDQGAALNTKVPNSEQGFGRISLPGSLYIAADPSEQAKMIVFLDASNNDLTVATGAAQNVCITATAVNGVMGPMKWTLVWTDPPASTGAGIALVNNLDLTVLTPEDTQLIGNGATDNVNNVEQVVIATPTPDKTYCATVRGTNVPSGPQPFALIVTGPVDPYAERPDSLHGGLSGGAAAAIVIVCLVVAGGAGAAAFILYRRRKNGSGGAKPNTTGSGYQQGGPQDRGYQPPNPSTTQGYQAPAPSQGPSRPAPAAPSAPSSHWNAPPSANNAPQTYSRPVQQGVAVGRPAPSPPSLQQGPPPAYQQGPPRGPPPTRPAPRPGNAY